MPKFAFLFALALMVIFTWGLAFEVIIEDMP
jgi:hypothetical protein